MTASQKRALDAGLVEVLQEYLIGDAQSVVTAAQWATDDMEGPGEYFTPEVEHYVERQIERIVKLIGKRGWK